MITTNYSRITDEASDVNAELVSLRAHKNNIPKRSLDLRKWMCGEPGLAEDLLPFVGELINPAAPVIGTLIAAPTRCRSLSPFRGASHRVHGERRGNSSPPRSRDKRARRRASTAAQPT
jgi:hypothetical protein